MHEFSAFDGIMLCETNGMNDMEKEKNAKIASRVNDVFKGNNFKSNLGN